MVVCFAISSNDKTIGSFILSFRIVMSILEFSVNNLILSSTLSAATLLDENSSCSSIESYMLIIFVVAF